MFLPTRAGWFFLFLLALFEFGRPQLLLGDGGTSRHIITGLYFFQNGVLPTTNHICRLAPDYPWLTNSALTDIIFGASFMAWQLNGIVLIGAISIALSLTWSYQFARARGLGMLPGTALLLVITYISTIHWSARPHLLTYVTFMLTYYLTFMSTLDTRKRIPLIALTTLIWANLHGSFYLGLGMLGAKLVGDFLQTKDRKGLELNALALLAATAAACINTRGGAGFLTYILQYMSSGIVRYGNDEWRAIDFSVGLPIVAYLVLMAFVAACWICSSKRPPLGEMLFVIALGAFGVYAMRIIPYFTLCTLPAIAVSWAGLPIPPTFSHRDERLGLQEPTSWKFGLAVLATALAMSAYWLYGQPRLQDFDAEQLPVGTSDYLKAHGLDQPGFTKDNWAGYLYWKTGYPIFIDDYTDLYPPDIAKDYTTIYFGNPGWQAVLAKRNFSWILIPKWLPMAEFLKRDPMWKLSAQDASSLLFVRTDLK